MDQLDRRYDTALAHIDEAAKGRAASPGSGKLAGDTEPAPASESAIAAGFADDEDAAARGLDRSATGDDRDDRSPEPDDVPAVSRKVRRRRRRSRPRSKTIAMKRLTREELRIGRMMFPPVDVPRPQTRSQCTSDVRPCPWVACKYHLYLDVNPETGSIKINFPDLEPWELTETCALDVAERGGITLEEVGEIMNLTRERIRQVEVRGLTRLRASSPTPEDIGAYPVE